MSKANAIAGLAVSALFAFSHSNAPAANERDVARVVLACDGYLADLPRRDGSLVDCNCLANELVDNFGAATAEIITRMVAAGATPGDTEIAHVIELFGRERLETLQADEEKLRSVGQIITKTCAVR